MTARPDPTDTPTDDASAPATGDLLAADVPAAARGGSLLRELAAYEALWLRPETTTDRVSSWFRDHPTRLPSALVPEAELAAARERVLERLAEGPAEPFRLELSAMPDYPTGLRDARAFVPVLYRRGDRALLANAPRVAIIGSRQVSPAGERRTRKLAMALVRAGVTVVSGLADGVDTAAHNAAIAAGGRTVAVIGTPILEAYPKRNVALQRRIGAEHLLVSQVPILRHADQDPHANAAFFVERNATMAALSDATIIVEAQDRSGTLTQAHACLHQGRPLFALASCFADQRLTWPAALARQGARRLHDVDDVLDGLLDHSLTSTRTPK